MKNGRRRALVTGASLGIGAATARRLAQDGMDLILHYRNHADEVERLAKQIRSTGRRAETIRADLSESEGARSLAQGVSLKDEALDVLVHNAGEYPRSRFRELDPETFERTFRPHVFAAARLTHELLPLLERRGEGRVIFVSSMLALTGSAHGADYAAAKSALLGLARSLARELAPRVTVNAVAPGAIDTAVLAHDTPEQRKSRIALIPAGRLGRPEEVAAAVAFLASPEAAFITGATLHVNGGQWIG